MVTTTAAEGCSSDNEMCLMRDWDTQSTSANPRAAPPPRTAASRSAARSKPAGMVDEVVIAGYVMAWLDLRSSEPEPGRVPTGVGL